MSGLISVIIPVYNAEAYLQKCVNSILEQEYQKFELILVDDGSTDRSSNICDNYRQNDCRVKVIRKKNAGPGAAREEGVSLARGDYIAFVDADDYIDSNMFSILISEANKGVDIVQCGFRKVSTNGTIINRVMLRHEDILGKFNCASHYAVQSNTTNFLWNKLFKAELFENISFPKFYAGEDSCILTQAYAFAERVVNIGEPLYNYVMTPDSLCRQPFSKKKLDNIAAGKFMYNFYQKYYPELSGFSALHICSYAAKLYSEVVHTDIDSKEEKLNSLLSDFNKYYILSKERIVRRMSSKKRAYFVELFNINPKISTKLYRIYNH